MEMEMSQKMRHLSMKLSELKQEVNQMIAYDFVEFLPQVFDNVSIADNSEFHKTNAPQPICTILNT
jgi:hypothetical protein